MVAQTVIVSMDQDMVRSAICPSASLVGDHDGIVPNGVHVQVAELIDNFRKMREMLNEICAINAELLRRREDLG